ncbi:KRAB-A domain-containing protein 2 [Trichonephila clavipes]|nr:KRAB-A domain-containing protein 2 [Trichonephila clavipes]
MLAFTGECRHTSNTSVNDVCQQSQIYSGSGRKKRSRQRGDWLFPVKFFDLLGVSQLYHLTKFVHLRPLKTKRTEEIAYHVLSIFLTTGAPAILQSDNDREFSNQVTFEICAMGKDGSWIASSQSNTKLS